MKRRTIDPSKLRRPLKRSRITESIYGSVFLYVRFFLVWVTVLTADFLLEFRFEYLWPFWLLLRSAYDSFKYQGLAFSLLFLALAFCSDLICLMFLPVHWLFFAASTYVWVQFVWHTDRGLCLPTVSLWLLFVYVEASIRLRELKNLPFHLDLCRPFAAHCIGYPVVTLGYGVKSYVGYKMKQRKMQQVAKENEFYMQLINLALPAEVANPPDTSDRPSRVLCNGRTTEGEVAAPKGKYLPVMTNGINTKSDVELFLAKEASRRGLRLSDLEPAASTKGNHCAFKDYHALPSLSSKKGSEDHNLNELNKLSLEAADKAGKVHNGKAGFSVLGKNTRKANGKVNDKVKDFEEEEEEDSDSDSLSASSSSMNGSRKNSRSNSPKGHDKSNSLDMGPSLLAQIKEERALRRRSESNLSLFEADVKRLKAELHASRQCEQDLRCNMHTLMANERQAKSELQQLRAETEIYQQKNQALSATKQQDRNNIVSLERKLKTERDARLLAETQLRDERKKQKTEDAAAKYREEASRHESCIALKAELEDEIRQLRALFLEKEEELKRAERETEALRKKSKETESLQFKKETEILMSALTAMQGKNTHLENSLSSETRLKLDLFSALGETRRQLEITQNKLVSSERELEALKAKIAEAMAVMPSASYSAEPGVPCFTSNHATTPQDMNLHTRSLDPSAPCYVPTHKKNGLL